MAHLCGHEIDAQQCKDGFPYCRRTDSRPSYLPDGRASDLNTYSPLGHPCPRGDHLTPTHASLPRDQAFHKIFRFGQGSMPSDPGQCMLSSYCTTDLAPPVPRRSVVTRKKGNSRKKLPRAPPALEADRDKSYVWLGVKVRPSQTLTLVPLALCH